VERFQEEWCPYYELLVQYGKNAKLYSSCTSSGIAADTACIISALDDDDYQGSDAIASLCEAYDERRSSNLCEERPLPHERYLPASFTPLLECKYGCGINRIR
jgi:hypothetical protein